MTALQQLIEIIKQKRKESEISNTLLKFVHDEAIRLLETEKEQMRSASCPYIGAGKMKSLKIGITKLIKNETKR